MHMNKVYKRMDIVLELTSHRMVAASFIVGKTGLPEELTAFPSSFARSLYTSRSNLKKDLRVMRKALRNSRL